LLWLNIKAATLGLRYTHRDVFKILKRKSVLNEGLADVLDASDHIEDFGSQLAEIKGTAFLGVRALEDFFHLALLLEFILFNGDVELSQNIGMTDN
jgi:hypothetical protein